MVSSTYLFFLERILVIIYVKKLLEKKGGRRTELTLLCLETGIIFPQFRG